MEIPRVIGSLIQILGLQFDKLSRNVELNSASIQDIKGLIVLINIILYIFMKELLIMQ